MTSITNSARSLVTSIESWLRTILGTAAGSEGEFERPKLKGNKESNVPGLFVIGDLAGAPVIKLAMADGFSVIETIAAEAEMKQPSRAAVDADILVIGAGAAGLNAALAAQERGFSVIVLEKAKVANTIENFPEGKWVYAEPDTTPPKGKLWLDGATKEELVERWNGIIRDNRLDVRTEEELTALSKGTDGIFVVTSCKATYRARRVILATGQRGNPKKLGVPGEDQEHVYHRLYSPTKYKNEDILVVGGGNSAIEAALTLAKENRVTLSYRAAEFARLFKDNRRLLESAVAAGKIEVIFNSTITEFGSHEAKLAIVHGSERKTEVLRFDHAFVLIGAELPITFLKKLGLRLENEWQGRFWRAAALTVLTLIGLAFFGGTVMTVGGAGGLTLAFGALLALIVTGWRGDRFSWLGISFLVWHAIYGIKVGQGQEFWPFRGWGYEAFHFFGRPWSFWYTVIYTLLMTVFGLGAIKRWGIDRKDRFQIWRYVSLISFQWIFFFLVPEFLFQYAVEYRWVGDKLAEDPAFASQAWRSYGLIYAWPLFFYTFFYDPHVIWIVWGVLLTFVVIPVFVLFHGKRYCSWICGCGGLAETFGDRWRHLAPKGKNAIAWETMGSWILVFATIVTGAVLLRDIVGLLYNPSEWGMWLYRIFVDVWLVGILPVTLYPFLGGKVWCRYWCPLAKMMQFTSAFWAKKGKSRFRIVANDKCIACGECSRYCQVGINVMSYALKQETLDNLTSSCIGCGICVTVCPMDTLSFGAEGKRRALPVLQ